MTSAVASSTVNDTPPGPEAASRSGAALRTTILAGIAALVVLGICAWLDGVNLDEGWYIVSSRLAATGALPYRDFAYTQSPLLLYALVPSQWLARGIFSARVTSSVCAALGIGLTISTARRLGGRRAAQFSGLLLLCLFPALPYWLSVTKTYGLASLFLAATVAALTSGVRASVRLPLATATAAGFALTRTSGAALAAIVLVYCLYAAPDRRSRTRVAVVAAAIGVPCLALLGLAGDRAVWNLYSYHQWSAYWADPAVSTLPSRLRQVFVAWPFVSALVILVFAAVLLDRERSVLDRARSHPELVVIVTGMAAFVMTHLLGGAFYAEEYVSPLVPTAVMLGVVSAIRLRRVLPFGDRSLLVTAVVLALLLTPRFGYLHPPGSLESRSAIDGLASCVEQNSNPHDRVFALVMLEAVPAAHRTPVRGTSLGGFSYQDVSTARAEHLHILNSELVLRALNDPSTKVVVLADVDLQLLSFAGWFSQERVSAAPVDQALMTEYRPVCAGDVEREFQIAHATVYVRRASN